MSEAAGGGLRPASAWQLLRQPAFARFIGGNLLSNVGNWFQDIAAAILVFQVTGSASMVALVAIAGYGSALVLSPVGGQLADRLDRRRLLIVTHLAQGVAASALALLALAGQAGPVVIVVFTLVIGLGRAVVNPTLHALLPALVTPADLPQATALQAVTFNLARAVGPVLGALVMTQWGAAAAFGINAASFLGFAVILLGLAAPRGGPAAEGEGRGVLGGLRYVAARPRLVLLLVCATVVGATTDPVLTLGPAFAALFGEPEEWAGILVAAFGAGAVAAAVFASAVRRALGRVRTVAICLLVAAGGMLAIAVAPTAPVALAGAVLAGAAFLTGSTDVTAALQELIEDHVRGRVMALWTMGFLGSRPLAAALDGVLADLWSPRAAVAALAALVLLAGTGALAGYLRAGGEEAFRPLSKG